MDENKIHATIPISLYIWGKRIKSFEAHFEGVIKNRDTIINWKIVPPYPKINERLNPHMEYMKKPKTLYFIEGKELLGLDSLYKQRLKEHKSKENMK